MHVKFSEDVVPLSDLKLNPGKVVSQVNETGRPVLVTSRGRGAAVVQSVENYEKNLAELEFIKAVAKGLTDIRNGDVLSLEETRKALETA